MATVPRRRRTTPRRLTELALSGEQAWRLFPGGAGPQGRRFAELVLSGELR